MQDELPRKLSCASLPTSGQVHSSCSWSPRGFTEPAAIKFCLLKRLLSRIHPNPSDDVLGAQP